MSGVDASGAPEEVLTDAVKPLVDSGAAVLVQFSDPNSPGVRPTRRWENETNARRPERLALFRRCR
ncbi:hypothetical protein [Amycolatopsis sp. NPDC003731]